jgi:hypothetical protein
MAVMEEDALSKKKYMRPHKHKWLRHLKPYRVQPCESPSSPDLHHAAQSLLCTAHVKQKCPLHNQTAHWIRAGLGSLAEDYRVYDDEKGDELFKVNSTL